MKISVPAMLALPLFMAGLAHAWSPAGDYMAPPKRWLQPGKPAATETVTVTANIHTPLPSGVSVITRTIHEVVEETTVTRTTTVSATATDYAYRTGHGLVLSTAPLRYDDLLTNYTTAYMIKVAEEVDAMIVELSEEYNQRHDMHTFLAKTEEAIELLHQCAQIRKEVVAHIKLHRGDRHALKPGYTVFRAANNLLRVVDTGLVPYLKRIEYGVNSQSPLPDFGNTLQQIKEQNVEHWTAFEALGGFDDKTFAALTHEEKFLLFVTSYLFFLLKLVCLPVLISSSFSMILLVTISYAVDADNKSRVLMAWISTIKDKFKAAFQKEAAKAEEVSSAETSIEVKVARKSEDDVGDWVVVEKKESEAAEVAFSG
ncbi:hypothetical protein CLAFUW4_14478 [Fulvia fulva]|uniref:Uncharacterized protein n=1 Tax=Passalora fulva TaxID=5499 RepID=A0A9Q8PMD5_PASFU|nr:uncharacterized protein CLAFUR5_14310 [Fulvia fulva]KAK4609085.1 hypothetical protein CLAFUR4_14473 [Fulvia fulva]UJO25097.1 hypothetical protein CLAFUR5_14310 [Fulvia fulva]WPV22634.1 hypothetical protein CLAFUW4_14478 [Fulvia fulva]WPV37747.1 hypothetical protein CLAFUW7_14482 [Fulvia fulva]